MFRVLQVGLGPLGVRIVRDLAARGLGRVVAAVDPAPGLAGRPLSQLTGGAGDDVVVGGAVRAALALRPDVAIVTTSSDLARCAETFRTLLGAGMAIVSTCEELLAPELRHPQLAAELEHLAREHGGRLLAAGVNPGFLMDVLPLMLTAPCLAVRRVEAHRIQDASTRRLPFQVKIGAGLELAEFARRVQEGTLRHVGLPESLHFLARRLGFRLDVWEEILEPVVAEHPLECGAGPIAVGQAAGVRQVARGLQDGRAVVELVFQAAVGQPDPHDRVVVDGDPPVDLRISPGIHGDLATSALVLNSLELVRSAPPGLLTPAEIPLLRFDPSRPRRN